MPIKKIKWISQSNRPEIASVTVNHDKSIHNKDNKLYEKKDNYNSSLTTRCTTRTNLASF